MLIGFYDIESVSMHLHFISYSRLLSGATSPDFFFFLSLTVPEPTSGMLPAHAQHQDASSLGQGRYLSSRESWGPSQTLPGVGAGKVVG